MTSLFKDDASTTEEAEITASIDLYKQRFAKEDGSLDVDAMLKKMAHADKHIRTIETERSDIDVAAKLEEVLAKIEAKRNISEPQTQVSETADKNTPRNEVNIDELLEKKLNAHDQRKSRELNRQRVREELSKMWGNNWIDQLRVKTREIGETEEFMEELAANRPQTLLKLLKEDRKQVVDDFGNIPTSSVRLDTKVKGKLETYTDFQKLRKEDPKLYRSREVQDKLLKLATSYAQQGKSFTQT